MWCIETIRESVDSLCRDGADTPIVRVQEFELYPQASPLAEWLCVPSGKRMNVGSNPAVGAGFFRRGKLVSATDTEQEWP